MKAVPDERTPLEVLRSAERRLVRMVESAAHASLADVHETVDALLSVRGLIQVYEEGEE